MALSDSPAADGAAVHGCRFSGGGIYGIELSGIVLRPVEVPSGAKALLET